MPAIAPFQLWINGAPIATAIRVAGTVTITTASAHGLTTGAYIQAEGFTGAVGTSIAGVYQITAPSSTTFTFTSAGSAGTAVTSSSLTTEAFSFDVLNPIGNYASGVARNQALYVLPESLQMSASGDGEPSTMGFTVYQDYSPSNAPWFLSIPDQTRVRLIKCNTGTTPSAGQTFFRGFIQNIDAEINDARQGTIANVSAVDVNALLDRVVIYGEVK